MKKENKSNHRVVNSSSTSTLNSSVVVRSSVEKDKYNDSYIYKKKKSIRTLDSNRSGLTYINKQNVGNISFDLNNSLYRNMPFNMSEKRFGWQTSKEKSEQIDFPNKRIGLKIIPKYKRLTSTSKPMKPDPNESFISSKNMTKSMRFKSTTHVTNLKAKGDMKTPRERPHKNISNKMHKTGFSISKMLDKNTATADMPKEIKVYGKKKVERHDNDYVEPRSCLKMVKVTKHAQESSLHGAAVFSKEITRDQKIKYDLDVLEQSNKKQRSNSLTVSMIKLEENKKNYQEYLENKERLENRQTKNGLKPFNYNYEQQRNFNRLKNKSCETLNSAQLMRNDSTAIEINIFRQNDLVARDKEERKLRKNVDKSYLDNYYNENKLKKIDFNNSELFGKKKLYFKTSNEEKYTRKLNSSMIEFRSKSQIF